MPIHEYRCELCDHAFETLIRTTSDAPYCPSCGAIDVVKQFSVPAAAQTNGVRSSLPMRDGPASLPMGGCGMGGCGSGMCAMD
jgi:putative FmdB family regulatory protein